MLLKNDGKKKLSFENCQYSTNLFVWRQEKYKFATFFTFHLQSNWKESFFLGRAKGQEVKRKK